MDTVKEFNEWNTLSRPLGRGSVDPYEGVADEDEWLVPDNPTPEEQKLDIRKLLQQAKEKNQAEKEPKPRPLTQYLERNPAPTREDPGINGDLIASVIAVAMLGLLAMVAFRIRAAYKPALIFTFSMIAKLLRAIFRYCRDIVNGVADEMKK